MLHAYFEPAYHYDDIGVCNSQGVYRGTSNPLQDEENVIYGNKNIAAAKPIIFPNPTTGQITIDYLLQESERGLVKINDILGNEIFEIHLNNQVRFTTTQLPNLSKGLYLASVIINGVVVQNIKLVIK
jgi:hypothetical protein